MSSSLSSESELLMEVSRSPMFPSSVAMSSSLSSESELLSLCSLAHQACFSSSAFSSWSMTAIDSSIIASTFSKGFDAVRAWAIFVRRRECLPMSDWATRLRTESFESSCTKVCTPASSKVAKASSEFRIEMACAMAASSFVRSIVRCSYSFFLSAQRSVRSARNCVSDASSPCTVSSSELFVLIVPALSPIVFFLSVCAFSISSNSDVFTAISASYSPFALSSAVRARKVRLERVAHALDHTNDLPGLRVVVASERRLHEGRDLLALGVAEEHGRSAERLLHVRLEAVQVDVALEHAALLLHERTLRRRGGIRRHELLARRVTAHRLVGADGGEDVDGPVELADAGLQVTLLLLVVGVLGVEQGRRLIASRLVVVHRRLQLRHLLGELPVVRALGSEKSLEGLDLVLLIRDRGILLRSRGVAEALELRVQRPVVRAVLLALVEHVLQQAHHFRNRVTRPGLGGSDGEEENAGSKYTHHLLSKPCGHQDAPSLGKAVVP